MRFLCYFWRRHFYDSDQLGLFNFQDKLLCLRLFKIKISGGFWRSRWSFFKVATLFLNREVIFKVWPFLSKITFKSSTLLSIKDQPHHFFTDQYQTRFFIFLSKIKAIFSHTFSFSSSIFGFLLSPRSFYHVRLAPFLYFFGSTFKNQPPSKINPLTKSSR